MGKESTIALEKNFLREVMLTPAKIPVDEPCE